MRSEFAGTALGAVTVQVALAGMLVLVPLVGAPAPLIEQVPPIILPSEKPELLVGVVLMLAYSIWKTRPEFALAL